MSEVTGFCYFPLKNYQEFFVIQGSNSGAPTCWVLISPLSCSPSPKVVLLFYFLLFVSSSFVSLMCPPPSKLEVFCGRCVSFTRLYPLGSCLPRSYPFSWLSASVSCSSPPLPAEHWQKRSRPLRALLLPVLCELPGLGLARWEALLLFARLHSCNLSEPERGSSFSSISNLFRTKHCVVQSRRVYWRII